jgi:predicted AAA+ superfamily ATPase
MEERALVEAMKEFGLKQGIIINESIEKVKMVPKSKNQKIIYIPLWKYLLQI